MRPSEGLLLVIGGANMDIAARSERGIVAQDSNPGQVRFSPGGVARNIAENLARLGHSPRLITLVGQDMLGQSLLSHTQEAGVDVSGVEMLSGVPTATYVSLQGPDGDMAVAVNDMALLGELTPGRLQHRRALIERASNLVLDCNLPEATLDWLFAQAAQARIHVDSVSVAKCLRIQRHLGRIDTLKLNRQEAQALTGLAVQTPQQACAAAQALCGLGVRWVVISMGAQGLAWCEAGQAAVCQPAQAPAQVVSTTGAGDALLSGLIDGQLRGFSSRQTVAWAMACAEITLGVAAANAGHLRPARVLSHLGGVLPPP